MRKNGFTMVELIVVVTIIMVLSVVGIISFQGANQKARDGRRIADLEKIRIALESFRQTNGSYPANINLLVPDYMRVVPKDPRNSSDTETGYLYVPGGDDPYYSYYLYTWVEDAGTSMAINSPPSCYQYPCNYLMQNP